MATSTNQKIQQLMDEASALDTNDDGLEAKLQKIAEAVAAEQKKMRTSKSSTMNIDIVDPQDEFACEGCQ